MTDLRCYVVTSGSGRRTVEAAAAVAAAGAGVVQVRGKDLSIAELLELTESVAQAVAHTGAPTQVLVDDRVEVAWAARRRGVRLHGVHLGQDDLPVEAARRVLGADAVIGLSAGTLDMVCEAEARGGDRRPDYLGVGPFRLTPTKDSGRPPLGVAGYSPLVAATSLPVVAIGGVTPADVPALAVTGIAGTGMVRAVMGTADPASAVRAALAAWASAAAPESIASS